VVEMKKFPKHIQTKIYEFSKGLVSPEEMQNFIFEEKIIEYVLGYEKYTNLLSINFNNNKIAMIELTKILEPYIDKQYVETRRIYELLEKLINPDEDFIFALDDAETLYGKGYDFFREIVVNSTICVNDVLYDGSWEKMTNKEKEDLLEPHIFSVGSSAFIIKEWIDNGEIVLTGERYDRSFDYIDLRDPKKIPKMKKMPTRHIYVAEEVIESYRDNEVTNSESIMTRLLKKIKRIF
jgi:hypothetical protein